MRTILYCLALAVALTACSSSAADTGKVAPPEKKRPSLFAQPKKQTSSEQFAYANSLKDAGRIREAARQYSALTHKWADAAEAPAAQMEYARLLEKLRDYSAAFEEYEYLVQNYSSGFPFSEVLESEFRIANVIMTTRHRFLGILPGSPGFETALPLFEKIVLNGPRWSGTSQAQFNIGWIHEQLGAYDLAVAAYELVQQNYSKSASATNAAFQQGHCLYLIAKDRPHEERSSQMARTHLQKILRMYPDHESAGVAATYLAEVSHRLANIAYDRAVFYDKTGLHPKAALLAYTDFVNKFPDSAQAEAARKRIDQLASKANPKSTEASGDMSPTTKTDAKSRSGSEATGIGTEEE